MSHHDHTPHIRSVPEPSIQDRAWGAQEQLHDIARRLARPGSHGAQFASDLYDILGALKVAIGNVEEIIRRAEELRIDAANRRMISRPYSYDDSVSMGASALYANLLARTLDAAQSSISDIGGQLTAALDDRDSTNTQQHNFAE